MRWCLALFVYLFPAVLCAGELPDYAQVKIEGVIHTAVGVTRRDTPIAAFVSREDSSVEHNKQRIVLVGGYDGDRLSVDAALDALRWFYEHEDAAEYRKQFTLAVIPCGNPDGLLLDKGEENGQGGQPGERAPRGEKSYHSKTNVEAQYINSWLGQHAPSAVYSLYCKSKPAADDFSLSLEHGPVSKLLTKVFAQDADRNQFDGHSARDVLRARILREDQQVIAALLKHYGHTPRSRNYFDTLPLLAAERLREAGIDVASPAYTWGDALPKSGSELSGLLYLSGRKHSLTPADSGLLQRAAGLAFDKENQPLKEPPFHNQMSDAVFMNGPIMTAAGAILKEDKYFDCCAQQQTFMRKLCKRDDGLYRHSPLNEAAWGRGNGFVALGNALMLEQWPKDRPDRKTLLVEYQQHMAALRERQDYTGMWHQVIDRPESYREFSCTSMIGFAMACGVRHGWLDAKEYQPTIDLAWQGAKERFWDDGSFVDVCTGTGKQKTLRDYYDREALTGRDARGGAMMLMFASEMVRK